MFFLNQFGFSLMKSYIVDVADWRSYSFVTVDIDNPTKNDHDNLAPSSDTYNY